MIKAVIFDLDGVIADTPQIYFSLIRDFLAGKGLAYTEEMFSEEIGVPFRVKVDKINRELGAEIDFEEYQSAVKTKSLEIFRQGLDPTSGLHELLAMLKENSLRIAIATNNNADSVQAILKTLGIRDEFEFVVDFSMISRPKPDPEIYALAVNKLGLPLRECVAVEDTALGVHAAKAAGIKCIAMPNKLDMHGDFSIADARVSSLGEITMELLGKLGGE
ncbi:MAG: HAD family phosphatase [Candidatus Diapherotrites archaeon]|nr:HAD family phosphatase [Candidatus Micrarchaeota archaeon]MBU1939938.1 HAD family phosphatase [Candidatus Micrarchaeota archaeon]